MKVFMVGLTEHPWRHANLLYAEACRQGYDVGMGAIEMGGKTLWNNIRAYKPDWVMVFGATTIHVDSIKYIASQYKTCIWDAYAPCFLLREQQWEALSGVPRAVITSVKGVKDRYGPDNDNFKWIPQYYDEEYFKPTIKRDLFEDVCFIGSCNDDRERIEWLTRLQVDGRFGVNVYGQIPPLSRRWVVGSEMANIYRQHKLTIDIERSGVERIPQILSDRSYKAMGCGCPLLTYQITDLDLVFKPGVHLMTYDDTYDDLVDKIRYWLDHDKERELIAAAGHAEVMANHTLKKKLPEYWAVMEDAA